MRCRSRVSASRTVVMRSGPLRKASTPPTLKVARRSSVGWGPGMPTPVLVLGTNLTLPRPALSMWPGRYLRMSDSTLSRSLVSNGLQLRALHNSVGALHQERKRSTQSRPGRTGPRPPSAHARHRLCRTPRTFRPEASAAARAADRRLDQPATQAWIRPTRFRANSSIKYAGWRLKVLAKFRATRTTDANIRSVRELVRRVWRGNHRDTEQRADADSHSAHVCAKHSGGVDSVQGRVPDFTCASGSGLPRGRSGGHRGSPPGG